MSDTLYEPSAWQANYHARTENEVLGAGSAGPGKTECLLHDPMQQILTEQQRCQGDNPQFPLDWGHSKGWALHLRRTFPMLASTLVRAKRIFPLIDPGVHFVSSEHTFVWSSGYRTQFGHCQNADDWIQYQSAEFCVAGGTGVVMADGSTRAVEDVAIGDSVLTLEGPKRVTATHRTGIKPCVEVSVHHAGALVGKQRQPTTHPVLCASIGGWRPEPSANTRQSERRSLWPSVCWQDYESLLCGRPESAVARASAVALDTVAAGSNGSRQAGLQLPTLSVPVVLHARSVRRAASLRGSPNRSDEASASPSRSEHPRPAAALRLAESATDPLPLLSTAQPSADRAEDCPVCGIAYALPGSQTGAGCSLRYSSSGREPRDERATHAPADGRPRVRLPADAEARNPTGSSPGDPGETRTGSTRTSRAYPHFYTGEPRPCSEECLAGTARMEFVGWLETFDLTVEDANHYLTEAGLVNANTHIAYDELSQFEEEQYHQINSRLRTSDPLLTRMRKIRAMSNPIMRREANFNTQLKDPFWVRKRFVEPHRDGNKVIRRKVVRQDGTVEYKTRLYLPASLYDNPNKQFVADYELELLDKPPHIRHALLYGNWYMMPGGFYSDAWNDQIHVCKPFRIPDHWPRFRSMDWGYKQPGCVGWWAIGDDETLYCEREFTFRGMEVPQVAKRIAEIEKDLGLWYKGRSLITGPADNQIWEERGDAVRPKVAEFAAHGVPWVQADKRSRSRAAQLLLGRMNDHQNHTKSPGIVFFETCTMCRSTIPGIMADPSDPETPQDGGQDHHHDMALYATSFASHGKRGVPLLKRYAKSDDDDDDDDRKKPGIPNLYRRAYGPGAN